MLESKIVFLDLSFLNYILYQSTQTNEWVGYENRDSLQHRCDLINDEGFGGAMFWDTSTDDFTGQFCDEGKYPLIRLFSSCLVQSSWGLKIFD